MIQNNPGSSGELQPIEGPPTKEQMATAKELAAEAARRIDLFKQPQETVASQPTDIKVPALEPDKAEGIVKKLLETGETTPDGLLNRALNMIQEGKISDNGPKRVMDELMNQPDNFEGK